MNNENPIRSRLMPAPKNGGFKRDDMFIWCGSVVKGEDGRYHMFASAWERELGFGVNWLFNCRIVRASSDTPEGPYTLEETVLGRRDRSFFDGMNVHNPSIKYHNGTYYLYYFGTTYGGPVPKAGEDVGARGLEVWNNKRIGLATSNSVFGPWKRRDKPILEPRRPGSWDCTVTTNPSAAILPDGTTYMIYKSREYAGSTLCLGVAKAASPDGEYRRVTDRPIFDFANPDFHVEDPYLWYSGGKFKALFKDDFKNNCGGITGEWGSGVYAESDDCVHWEIYADPKAYSRTVTWDDGTVTTQCNLERPNLLFDENGVPTHLFLATGDGNSPYAFTHTWNMCIPLKK